MQSLLVLLAVAGLSVLASSQWLLEAGRFFQLAQLSASGLLFLALGALLGPAAGHLLSAEDLVRVRPILALGLGFGGILVGINLDLRVMRLLPRPVYLAAFSQSSVAFVAVSGSAAGLLLTTTSLTQLQALGAASVLGAAASVSSGHLAVLWARLGRIDRLKGFSVSLLTMLDDLTGLFVLAVALVFGASADPGRGLLLVVLAMGLGVVCGALLAFLLHHTADGAERMAVLVGGVALVSGVAAYLRISALLCGLFCGVTLALVGGKSVERIYRALARVERPVYLVLLFLIGAHVDLTLRTAWIFLPLFVVFRFVGKLIGGQVAYAVAQKTLSLPPRLGFALLAQGGLSLCVLTDYLLLVPVGSALIFPVGVMAALVNEVVASRAFRHSLVPGAAHGA